MQLQQATYAGEKMFQCYMEGKCPQEATGIPNNQIYD